jgi:single-stranded DNA-binding protein
MSSNNINSVVVNGRLTDDPKLYETSGENVYALLHIAINRRIGKDRQRTIYYDVKVWNGHARACVEHLRKGGLVSVGGHLDQYDKPATEERPKQRWNFISAEEVEFCSRPRAEGSKAAEVAEDE